jgi:hypothetical protein
MIFYLSGSFAVFRIFSFMSSWLRVGFGSSPLKTHFGFFRGFGQGFPGNETDLPDLGQGLNLVFAPEGRRIIGLWLLKNQFHGPVGGRVLAALARIMGFDAPGDILGDARVITSVDALGDVQMPLFLVFQFQGIPRCFS